MIGTVMNRRRWIVGGAIAVVAAAIAIGVWMWSGGRDSRGGGATRSTVTGTTAGGGAKAIGAPTTANARIAVTVVNAAGGAPLAGATITLRPTKDLQDPVVITTGTDGKARADGLSSGAWSVTASAGGYEPSETTATLRDGQDTAVDLRLAAGGRTLTGKVTDVHGGAVVGARVDAMPTTRSGATASGLTGDDGTYAVSVVEGSSDVAVSHADYAPARRQVAIGPDGGVADFALIPGGAIEGTVRDRATGAPIPDAVVVARAPNNRFGGALRIVATGADGAFRLAALSPGSIELTARGAGKASTEPVLVSLGVAEQLAGVDVLVSRAARVSGTVVDHTGKPVADSMVMMWGGEPETQGEKTDDKGAFAFDAVQPGRYQVFAGRGVMFGSSKTPPVTIVVADADITDVEIEIARSIPVRGHVEPRQRATVRVERFALDGRSGSWRPDDDGPGMIMVNAGPVTTDDKGEFELDAIEPGALRVVARTDAGDHGAAKVVVGEDGADGVVVPLAAGASVAGRIVDQDGKPVAGAGVMATRTEGGREIMIRNGAIVSGVQALTGADGSYELRGLDAGKHEIAALDRGRPLGGSSPRAAVSLKEGEKKTGVDLTVERPKGTIAGVVVGADGAPVKDAWVSLRQDPFATMGMLRDRPDGKPGGKGGDGDDVRSERVTVQIDESEAGMAIAPPVLTDDRGRFQFTGLRGEPVEVVAEAGAGRIRGRVAGVTPDANVTVKVEALTDLVGTVTAGGAPVKSFTVELTGPIKTSRRFQNGAFSFSRVDPGSYTLRVTSDDGNATKDVTVIAGQRAEVTIVLAANARVAGKVVTKDGKPAAGLPVITIPPQPPGQMQIMIEGMPATTDAEGKFDIEADAGPRTLVVLGGPANGGPTQRPNLVLEPGKTLDVGTIVLGDKPADP
jgi:protocatechuate 3,4-dioxygenase beta subunit